MPTEWKFEIRDLVILLWQTNPLVVGKGGIILREQIMSNGTVITICSLIIGNQVEAGRQRRQLEEPQLAADETVEATVVETEDADVQQEETQEVAGASCPVARLKPILIKVVGTLLVAFALWWLFGRGEEEEEEA